MFNPDGCFCCEPPEDPCVLSGCTWSSTEMSDTDLTAGTAYYNPVSGVNPDGTYEITNAQLVGTGNDPPCRKITIETVEAPQKPDTVYAICWKDNATHNPSTQCPLTSVSFCVESKRHDDSDATNSLTDAVVFVVRQNNRIYATASQSVGVNWKRASGSYVQNSFTEIDGAGNPNFTATGTAIEFGFALRLQVNEDDVPYDVVMFDNLCITRNHPCQGACSNTNCDIFLTGETGGISLHTLYGDETESVLFSHGVSDSRGLPAPSFSFTWTPSDILFGDAAFSDNDLGKTCVAFFEFDDYEIGGGCRTITGISYCMNQDREAGLCAILDGGSCRSGGYLISPVVYQDGSVFICDYPTVNPGQTVPMSCFKKLASVDTSISSPYTQWFLKVFTPEFPVSFPSASDPMTVGFAVLGYPYAKWTGDPVYTPTTLYLDNICVKPILHPCEGSYFTANISGVSVGYSPSSADCSSANVAAVNSAINSSVVLTGPTISGGYCQWMYTSPYFGTGPGAMFYQVVLRQTGSGQNGFGGNSELWIFVGGNIGGRDSLRYFNTSYLGPCSGDSSSMFLQGTINLASGCASISGPANLTIEATG